MIDYRDTHEIDLDQLEALLRAGGFKDKERSRLEQQVSGARYVVSAWEGERLVGFARAISDGATNAYVSSVAVLPEYRGRGIGRAMIVRLLEGKDGILFVLHARAEVKEFYVRCGFSEADDMMRRSRKF
jgi:N-acetylglutamate synthase-like GNAT family acetyltransferase